MTTLVIRMTILGDTTTWSVTYNCHSDNTSCVIYDCNILNIQSIGLDFVNLFFLIYE
jgi:hypothetical protein